ncbi:MAG: DinB family protein [Chloroflexota bacterium]
MDAERRAALVARYEAGSGVLRAAVDGRGDAELDRRPADGGWTPREVVQHVADSEMTSAIRLRRLIAEDEPLIVAYDGDEFARRLHYADRPIGPALAAIEAARSTTSQILQRLTEAEWSRMGTHSDSGTYGVEDWLETYAVHCDEHADQIRAALEA